MWGPAVEMGAVGEVEVGLGAAAVERLGQVEVGWGLKRGRQGLEMGRQGLEKDRQGLEVEDKLVLVLQVGFELADWRA